MAVHAAVFDLVVDVALGSWLGVMAFFSFVGAPRAFAVYGGDGGAYVNDVFPRYYRLGVVLGTAGLVAAIARGVLGGVDSPTLVVVGSTAVAVLLAAYSVGSLVPRMDAAGEEAFERVHRRSVVLNGVTLLAIAIALAGSHLP